MKKKKFIILITILLFIIVLSIIVFLNIYNKDLVYKNNLIVNIGDELPTIDKYIDTEEQKRLNSNKIEWEDVPTEDGKLYNAGKYTGYIKFKDKKVKVTLEVIDDEAPLLEGVEDITIYVNTEVNLLSNIKTNDNSHDKIDVKINGEYNISKVGEYQLSYVAADKSGNEVTKEFKLIIKEKELPKPSTPVGENVVIGKTSKGYTIKRINGAYYVNDILIANKTYNLSSSYAPGGMLTIFMNAFNKMQADAAAQGIELSIVSGYRSYSRQNTLYNNYVARDGKVAADTYSARAGHSEHQTGLAADINSLYQSFINTAEGQWLNNNCYKYGFIIRYPQGKESITGYMYEPWHIRYVGVDIATKLYNNGNWLSLEEYLGITSVYNY